MKKFFVMACMAISMLTLTAHAEDVWDGSTDTEWATDANGNYLIYTAEELAGLASKVNDGESYSGKTFLLMDDINLANYQNWVAIGYVNGMVATGTFEDKRFFSGTFDGQGHTVSKYYLYEKSTSTGATYSKISGGLFGAISDATICNLVVRDSYLYMYNNHYSNAGGAIVGLSVNSTITKCTSINNTVEVYSPYLFKLFGAVLASSEAYAGGICGASVESLSGNTTGFNTNNSTTITDCTVVGNTVKADGSKSSGGDNAATVSPSGTQSGNKEYASETAMKNEIATINRNTIIYNNFGVGNAPATPYYLDENTGMPTPYIFYAYMGIGDDMAQAGSYNNMATMSYDGVKIDNFEYNDWQYTLYPAGAQLNVTFNLNGWSEDMMNNGWAVEKIFNATTQNTFASSLVSQTDDSNLNPATGRYNRTLVYNVTVPNECFGIFYTTINNTEAWAAANRAAILYNNFGEGTAPASPYYINEVTGEVTDYIYYMYQGIDDSEALAGTVRKSATIEHGALRMDFEKDGNTYILYPAGYPSVTASFYTEGFSGDWSNAGYFVNQIINKNTGEELEKGFVAMYGDDGYDKDGNATYDADKMCFMRTEEFEITMPEAPLYIVYNTQMVVPTNVEDANNATWQVYGIDGELVVNTTTATDLVVVSIDGRVVYKASVEGECRIALPAGIYIANNKKVVVR